MTRNEGRANEHSKAFDFFFPKCRDAWASEIVGYCSDIFHNPRISVDFSSEMGTEELGGDVRFSSGKFQYCSESSADVR